MGYHRPMIWLLYTVRTLHIAFAALWFVIKLGSPRDIKASLGAGSEHTALLVARVNRATRISLIGGLGTILSGFGLIFLMGGFGAVSPRIHTGLTLALVLLGLEWFGQRRVWGKIASAAEAGKLEDALVLAKPYTALAGVSQLLWTVILVLMVFRF